MTQKLKIAAATAAVSIAGLSLAACGSSSDPNAVAATGTQLASEQTGSGDGGPFANLTSEDIKCLKEQGVTLPSGRPDHGGWSDDGGKSDDGNQKDKRHALAAMPTPAEMKKAAKACDVDLPTPGTMGGPGGPPQGRQGQMMPPPSGQAPSGAPVAPGDSSSSDSSGSSSSSNPPLSTQQS